MLTGYLDGPDGLNSQIRRERYDDNGALRDILFHKKIARILGERKVGPEGKYITGDGHLEKDPHDSDQYFIAVSFNDLPRLNKEGGHGLGDIALQNTVERINLAMRETLNNYGISIAEDETRDEGDNHLLFQVFHTKGSDFIVTVNASLVGDRGSGMIQEIVEKLEGGTIEFPSDQVSIEPSSLSVASINLEEARKMFNELQTQYQKADATLRELAVNGDSLAAHLSVLIGKNVDANKTMSRLMLGTLEIQKEYEKVLSNGRRLFEKIQTAKGKDNYTEALAEVKRYYEEYVRQDFQGSKGKLGEEEIQGFEEFSNFLAAVDEDEENQEEELRNAAFLAVSKRAFNSVAVEGVEDKVITGMAVYQAGYHLGHQSYKVGVNGPFLDYLRESYRGKEYLLQDYRQKGKEARKEISEDDLFAPDTASSTYRRFMRTETQKAILALEVILEGERDPELFKIMEGYFQFEQDITPVLFSDDLRKRDDSDEKPMVLREELPVEFKVFTEREDLKRRVWESLEAVRNDQAGPVDLEVLHLLEEVINKRNELIDYRYDQLTGLPNRQEFFEDSRQWLVRSLERTGEQVNVAFIDLGFLKYFNRVGGRKMGNLAVNEAAIILEYLVQALGDEFGIRAKAYRYAGDEFVFMFSGPAMGERIELADGSESSVSELLEEAIREMKEKSVEIFAENVNSDYVPEKTQIDVGIATMESGGRILEEKMGKDNREPIYHQRDINRLSTDSPEYDIEFHAEELSKAMTIMADESLTPQKAVSRLQLLVERYLALKNPERILVPDGEKMVGPYSREELSLLYLFAYSGKAISGKDISVLKEAARRAQSIPTRGDDESERGYQQRLRKAWYQIYDDVFDKEESLPRSQAELIRRTLEKMRVAESVRQSH